MTRKTLRCRVSRAITSDAAQICLNRHTRGIKFSQML